MRKLITIIFFLCTIILVAPQPDTGEYFEFEDAGYISNDALEHGYHPTTYTRTIENALQGTNAVAIDEEFLVLGNGNVSLDASTNGVLKTSADQINLDDPGSNTVRITADATGLNIDQDLSLGGNRIANLGSFVFTGSNDWAIAESSGNLRFGTNGGSTAVLTLQSDRDVEVNGGNLLLNNNRITNVADPVNAQDAATKSYVDSSAGPSYTAGNGLLLSGSDFSVDSPTCSSSERLRWTGSSFTCSSTDTSTSNEIQTLSQVLNYGKDAQGQDINNVGTLRADEIYVGENPNVNKVYVDETSDKLCYQYTSASVSCSTSSATCSAQTNQYAYPLSGVSKLYEPDHTCSEVTGITSMNNECDIHCRGRIVCNGDDNSCSGTNVKYTSGVRYDCVNGGGGNSLFGCECDLGSDTSYTQATESFTGNGGAVAESCLG